MLKKSLDLFKPEPQKQLYQNKSTIDLQNKRDLAYEDKKKRRELYNREIFGSEIEKNKEYNPFYDNSYLHNINNISTLSQSQLIEKDPISEEKKQQETRKNEKNDKKDQMIQTELHFFDQNTKSVDYLQQNKRDKKAKVPYKPFFQEANDHQIFHKMKQDYQDFVRSEGKNPQNTQLPTRYNLHKGIVDDDIDNKNNNNEDFFDRKYKKENYSVDQKRLDSQKKNEGKKAYAQELNDLIMEKKQRKHIEKEKNDIISMKLIKDSLENSPFGRAGGGAPNRDAAGNMLIKKGIFVNDNYTLFKKEGPSFLENRYEKYPKDKILDDQHDVLNEELNNHNYNNNNNHNNNNHNNNNNNNFNNYQPNSPIEQNQQSDSPQYIPDNNNPQNNYNNTPQNPQYTQYNPQYNQPNQNYNYNSPSNPQYTNNNQYNNYNQNQRQLRTPAGPPSSNYQNNPNYLNNSQNNMQIGNEKLTPIIPKILDMKQIEKEFLLQTEYKRTYQQNGQNDMDLNALKNYNFFAFNEYDKKAQLKKSQEQALLQKILYDQIEDKRIQKEEQKKTELMKQQLEEDRLKKQRDEIQEKYRRDMEKKQMELQNIKDITLNQSELKTKNVVEIHETTKEIKENYENSRLLAEMKRKEDEKLREIQSQKALYEEKLEDVNSHLIILKSQLVSQQNMLNDELNKLKAESLISNEQRFRAQRDLENLREELKRQELIEEIRRNELSQALLKTKPNNKNSVIYPKFAKDFNRAFQYHQINNDYINDSLDSLVQRTNFIPINDYSKPIIHDNNNFNDPFGNKTKENYDDFQYLNSLTQATKVQMLPNSLGYEYNDFNARDVLKTNNERLEELNKLDKSGNRDMQSHLENLINDFNKQ